MNPPVPPPSPDPDATSLRGGNVALGMGALLCLVAGTSWSSWPLLGAAVCQVTALAWRVTRL